MQSYGQWVLSKEGQGLICVLERHLASLPHFCKDNRWEGGRLLARLKEEKGTGEEEGWGRLGRDSGKGRNEDI